MIQNMKKHNCDYYFQTWLCIILLVQDSVCADTTCDYNGKMRRIEETGLLEVCSASYSLFIPVCFSDKFGNEEARVVCRHLELPTDSVRVLSLNQTFNGGTVNPLTIYDATCSGTESELIHCFDVDLESSVECTTNMVIGIECSETYVSSLSIIGADGYTSSQLLSQEPMSTHSYAAYSNSDIQSTAVLMPPASRTEQEKPISSSPATSLQTAQSSNTSPVPTTTISLLVVMGMVPPMTGNSLGTTTQQTGIIIGVSIGVFSICSTILVSVVAIYFVRKYKHKQSLSSRHTLDDPTLTKDLHHSNDYVEKIELLSIIPNINSRPNDHSQSLLLKTLSSCLIRASDMKLIEKVGQGEFGVVYRGLLTKYKDNEPKLIPVAVKTLKRAFSHSAETEALIEEAEKMMHFDHLNVLSLTGVCVGLLESPCIVMPFMSNGSLLSYLRKEAADLTVSASSDDNIILDTTKQLLSMCLQVAKGMTYLCEHKFVHRDLAARNCMISGEGIIKVADFGLAEDVYTTEYFKQDRSSDESVKLPIKWMALESIHYGKFSEKSDVWSFGVLCWEVFSVGKSPYPGMGPYDVVKMLDSGERLDKPSNPACCDKMYSLILSCWDSSPTQRPQFSNLVDRIEEFLVPLAEYIDFSVQYLKKHENSAPSVMSNEQS